MIKKNFRGCGRSSVARHDPQTFKFADNNPKHQPVTNRRPLLWPRVAHPSPFLHHCFHHEFISLPFPGTTALGRHETPCRQPMVTSTSLTSLHQTNADRYSMVTAREQSLLQAAVRTQAVLGASSNRWPKASKSEIGRSFSERSLAMEVSYAPS